jgi:ribosomal protein S18 acetylase RimI-like enzyme
MNYTLRTYKKEDNEALKSLMREVEWGEHYVDVHANTANDLSQDNEGEVVVAEANGNVIGFISFKHQKLNFMTFVPTLVVSTKFHNQGLGKALLKYAEEQSRKINYRGIYLDTPDTNLPARAFYKAIGFHEAYTMPHYYLDDLNGVTYIKLFNRDL